jgi:hypothetical protein
MRTIPFLATAASIAAAATLATPAQAAVCVGCGFYISYDVDADYDVANIAMLQRTAGGGGITNSFTVPAGESTKVDPIVSTFLIGVATNLPGDADGQKHLVVFANQDWSASAVSIAFGTLFPTTLEAQLIQALENIGGATVDPVEIDWSYDTIGAFDGGDAEQGPNGSVAFAPGSDFSLVAFSDGTIIGSGTSSITAAPTAAVPEPAGWALMIGGFALVGGTLRARMRPVTRFA